MTAFERGKAFGRKGARVVVGCRVSGFFDCGVHGEAVSTFAQNDEVWVGLVKTDARATAMAKLAGEGSTFPPISGKPLYSPPKREQPLDHLQAPERLDGSKMRKTNPQPCT